MSQNYLYMHRSKGEALGIKDFGWAWVESHNGRIRAQVKLMEGVNPETVWTWNAIAKQQGTWGLSDDANESQQGFLMNHLIHELLPPKGDGLRWANSDPITGQAAWFDLRVKIAKAETANESQPAFDKVKPLPSFTPASKMSSYSTHPNINISRGWRDIFSRGEK